jgi:hypothetical protein
VKKDPQILSVYIRIYDAIFLIIRSGKHEADMILDGDYRGYRVAQLLSELLGGAELISFTLHWAEEGQPRETTCPMTPSSVDPAEREASPLTLSRVA